MTTAQVTEHEGSSPLSVRKRAIKFTPERLQQIINLVERGKSRDEIADILGVSVGSLQVTCSRLSISLRRPKIENGVHLLRKHAPVLSTIEPYGSLRSDSGQTAVIATPEQQRATIPDAGAASFAIRIQYRGMERTVELPITTHTIGQLAFEAALRDLTIGETIADLITAIVRRDLFVPVLDNTDPKDRACRRGTF